ncbi:hypothetical protein TRFO_17128 [Tritrichomonas foetus]|uniref:Uncharacterized protein n=1 Tax=Tritrichomonas foetus TaxID=1144522 RepID=A0A1J4KT81_9EUKA|nr:hypothetical protein TRFO_17128 [Tritrichomonas foetus]|eukprot:OHT12870.1 hypothetical protein TRFO_17128 [Tritrichomonas foetus]
MSEWGKTSTPALSTTAVLRWWTTSTSDFYAIAYHKKDIVGISDLKENGSNATFVGTVIEKSEISNAQNDSSCGFNFSFSGPPTKYKFSLVIIDSNNEKQECLFRTFSDTIYKSIQVNQKYFFYKFKIDEDKIEFSSSTFVGKYMHADRKTICYSTQEKPTAIEYTRTFFEFKDIFWRNCPWTIIASVTMKQKSIKKENFIYEIILTDEQSTIEAYCTRKVFKKLKLNKSYKISSQGVQRTTSFYDFINISVSLDDNSIIEDLSVFHHSAEETVQIPKGPNESIKNSITNYEKIDHFDLIKKYFTLDEIKIDGSKSTIVAKIVKKSEKSVNSSNQVSLFILLEDCDQHTKIGFIPFFYKYIDDYLRVGQRYSFTSFLIDPNNDFIFNENTIIQPYNQTEYCRVIVKIFASNNSQSNSSESNGKNINNETIETIQRTFHRFNDLFLTNQEITFDSYVVSKKHIIDPSNYTDRYFIELFDGKSSIACECSHKIYKLLKIKKQYRMITSDISYDSSSNLAILNSNKTSVTEI